MPPAMAGQPTRREPNNAVQRIGCALCLSLLAHAALLTLPRSESGPKGSARSVTLEARLEAPETLPRATEEPSVMSSPSDADNAASIMASPVESARAMPPEEPRPTPTGPPPRTPSAELAAALPLARDPTYYPVGALDTPPRPLGSTDLCYPEGASGEISYLLLIDEAGTVDQASIVAARPEGLYTADAIAACRSVKFTPAVKDGRAVRSRVRFVVGPATS